MRSQYRGPMAAHELASHPTWPASVRISVLSGGYSGWRKRFGTAPELYEDLARGITARKAGEGAGVKDTAKGDGEWVDEPPEEHHSIEIRQRMEGGNE